MAVTLTRPNITIGDNNSVQVTGSVGKPFDDTFTAADPVLKRCAKVLLEKELAEMVSDLQR